MQVKRKLAIWPLENKGIVHFKYTALKIKEWMNNHPRSKPSKI